MYYKTISSQAPKWKHMEKVQRLVHSTYTSSDVEIGDNFKPSLSNEHLSELKLLFYLRRLYDIRYIKY